jgi:hypothetical protein
VQTDEGGRVDTLFGVSEEGGDMTVLLKFLPRGGGRSSRYVGRLVDGQQFKEFIKLMD